MAMTPACPPQPPQSKTLRGVFFTPSAATGYVAYFVRNATGEVIRMGSVRDYFWDDAFHHELFDWLNRKDPLPIEDRSPLALVRGSSA